MFIDHRFHPPGPTQFQGRTFQQRSGTWEHGHSPWIFTQKVIHQAVLSWDLTRHLGLITWASLWHDNSEIARSLHCLTPSTVLKDVSGKRVPTDSKCPIHLLGLFYFDRWSFSITENFPCHVFFFSFLAPTLYLTFKAISLFAIKLDDFQRTYYMLLRCRTVCTYTPIYVIVKTHGNLENVGC